ncbi:MAG: minichromosome maintenance protein MCM [Candidatus Aenigmarchaeota archaeon]|nr:minichromosome maintenance protein MCM [Candidatus Aenigmarchaeota archaeon]
MEKFERLHNFLREYYYADIQKQMTEDMPALIIDFSLFDMFDPVLADELLENPEPLIKEFTEALKMFDSSIQKMNVRVKNLPEKRYIRLRNLRAEHIGKLLCTDVIVKSATEIKPQIYEIIYSCPECSFKIPVPQEDSTFLQKPSVCSCGFRGEFAILERKMYDFRWLRGVEPFEITTGEQPTEIMILVKEDLTTPKIQKKTDPGARLRITGILKEVPRRIKGKVTTILNTHLEVNHIETSGKELDEIEITPDDEAKILEIARDPNVFDRLRASIAPGIYGFNEIKESIVLQLFGGQKHILPDGSRVRGNIHILLTGDPGTGKSMLLKLASSIVPRGRYVSGSGVSGVGLTASVRKDEVLGSWVLEAGALILCNKGLIAIDEFDKMSKDDQIAMHEATSIETVSIAKASIIATLPAETAVIAGANPRHGRFEAYKSILEQVDIPETLLSRFDLKFALKDIPDKVHDEQMAEHILTSRIVPESIVPEIDVDLLRKYIAYAKRIENIMLTKESADMLKNFYVEMRNAYPDSGIVSITLRQYEALLRIAEACAKVRLDNKVSLDDARRSIRLVKFSLMQLGYDSETGRIDIDKIESGITSSTRSKLRIIQDIISDLQKETGKEVAVSDVEAQAQEQGIEGNRVRDVIDRLKREGLVFEPKPGYIKKT